MTIQMLQYFLAIARTQNFTRAAEECFVTQPTLSRAIRDLEEELDCKLIKRTSRSVELTEAGEVCAAEAQRVLNDVHRLMEKVHDAARIQETPLRVGYIIYDHLMCFVQLLANPDDGELPITIEPKYADCGVIKQRFAANDLDMLILPEPSAMDLEDVEMHRISRGKAYAIVPRDCPLFERESVALSELKEYPVIAWNAKDVPLLDAAFTNMFVQAGFRPKVVSTAEKMGDMLTKIMLYKAIGFGTNAAISRSSNNVRYIEIADSPESFGIVCVWHKGSDLPQLERLKQVFLSD